MFEFLDEAGGRSREENVAITKAMLEALPEKIEWIRASTVACNAKGAPEGNWDLVLITDFDSLEDLERYREHPDHVAVGTFMRPVRRSRACVDFEI
jgi:hypothetical protein